MKLLSMVSKNLRVIFRKPSSLILLVLGPLLLIALIGFAFSSDTLQGIKIGVAGIDLEQAMDVLDVNGTVLLQMDSAQQCIGELRQREVHLCAVFSQLPGNGDEAGIGTEAGKGPVQITFYYDNSNINFIKQVLRDVESKVVSTGKDITLGQTRTILSDINSAVLFMQDAATGMMTIRSEALQTRDDLLNTRAELAQIRSDFGPVYARVKELQPIVNERTDQAAQAHARFRTSVVATKDSLSRLLVGINQSIDDMNSYFASQGLVLQPFIGDALSTYTYPEFSAYISNGSSIDEVNSYIKDSGFSLVTMSDLGLNDTMLQSVGLDTINTTLVLINQSIPPADILSSDAGRVTWTLINVYNDMYGMRFLVDDASAQLDDGVAQYDDALTQLYNATGEFNNSVYELDRINDFLNESDRVISESVVKIDRGVGEIDQLSLALDEKIQLFTGLNESSAENLINPIITDYKPIIARDDKIYYVFPLLLVFITMFIAVLLANMMVVNDLNSPAAFRNFILPVRDWVFVVGQFISAMVIVLAQVVVLAVIAQLQFGIDMLNNFWTIALSIVLVAALFTLVGMLIAYVFRSKQTSLLVGIFFCLAIFLFSDMIFPLEVMPPAAYAVAQFNPLVLAENIIEKALFFGIPLGMQLFDVVVLAWFTLVSFVLVLIAFHRDRKRG